MSPDITQYAGASGVVIAPAEIASHWLVRLDAPFAGETVQVPAESLRWISRLTSVNLKRTAPHASHVHFLSPKLLLTL